MLGEYVFESIIRLDIYGSKVSLVLVSLKKELILVLKVYDLLYSVELLTVTVYLHQIYITVCIRTLKNDITLMKN